MFMAVSNYYVIHVDFAHKKATISKMAAFLNRIPTGSVLLVPLGHGVGRAKADEQQGTTAERDDRKRSI